MHNRLTKNWWEKFHCKPEELENGERWHSQGYQHSKAGRSRAGPHNKLMPAPVMAAVHWATSHTNPEASAKGPRQLCKHSLPFVQLLWSEWDAYSQGSTKWTSLSIQNNVSRIQNVFISSDFVTLNIDLPGWTHLLLIFAANVGE